MIREKNYKNHMGGIKNVIEKEIRCWIGFSHSGFIFDRWGTYAYFSDQEVTHNKFAAGTLDFAMRPTTSLNLDNLKPGDKILKNSI